MTPMLSNTPSLLPLEFIDQYAVQSMDDFSDPLQVCVGFFLKICSICKYSRQQIFVLRKRYLLTALSTFIRFNSFDGTVHHLAILHNKGNDVHFIRPGFRKLQSTFFTSKWRF